MKIIKNYFYNGSYQLFLIILPIITLPYVARVLGPTYLGINSYTNSIINYFVLFAVLGTTTYGQREIAYHKDDKSEMYHFFVELELLNIITTCISFGFLMLIIFLMPNYHVFMWAYSISVVANVFDISWLFMGTERFSILVLRNFVVKVVSVILIFTFVKNSNDLVIYILINSLSILISNLLLWPYLNKILDLNSWHRSSLHPLKHLRGTIALFIPQISITLYTVLNKVLLGSMGKIKEESYFDNSDKIIRLIFTALTSLSTVIMPVIAHEISNREMKKVQKLLKYSLTFSLCIGFPLLFGLIAISSKLVPLFLGEQYNAVIPLLKIQAVILIPMAIANVVGNQYLVPARKSKELNISIFSGSIFNVIVSVPLIYKMGALGAVYTVLASETLVTVMQLFQVKNVLSFKGIGKDVAKCLLASIVMFTVVYLEQYLLSGWSSILIAVVLGIVVYSIMLFILKVSILDTIVLMVRKRV